MKIKLLFISLAFLAGLSQAAIVIDAKDDKTRHTVKIAASELTRIGFEGARMKGFRYKSDELDVDEDKATGVVYLQPLKSSPISVFATSQSGNTYELVLEPTAGAPIESILIRESASARRGNKPIDPAQSVDKAGALEIAVKRLFTAMAKNEEAGSDVLYEKKNQLVTLWRESRFLKVGRYSSRTLVGEAYKLMNISKGVMKVAEQEFYVPGVIAVSVENQVLRPGEETNVFVVRANAEATR